MTSPHSEHFGDVVMLVLLLALSSDIVPTTPILLLVTIWIDNLEMQIFFNSTPFLDSEVTEYNTKSDSDLWQLIIFLRQYLPISTQSKWIKSHQDKKRISTDLEFNAELNFSGRPSYHQFL